MDASKVANLAVRFLLQLYARAALAYWAARTRSRLLLELLSSGLAVVLGIACLVNCALIPWGSDQEVDAPERAKADQHRSDPPVVVAVDTTNSRPRAA